MADPICRWRNATPETLCELVSSLPHNNMSEISFHEYMKRNRYGEAFFRTIYQLACQLGLYYISDNNEYIPRFSRKITNSEAEDYLKFWIHRYYIPNPYTKKGFKKLEHPIYLVESFVTAVKSNPGFSFSKICETVFQEPHGNDDILKNALNRYSEVIKIEDDKIILVPNYEEIMDLTNVDRNDKKTFFENFNYENKDSQQDLKQFKPCYLKAWDKGSSKSLFKSLSKSFLIYVANLYLSCHYNLYMEYQTFPMQA